MDSGTGTRFSDPWWRGSVIEALRNCPAVAIRQPREPLHPIHCLAKVFNTITNMMLRQRKYTDRGLHFEDPIPDLYLLTDILMNARISQKDCEASSETSSYDIAEFPWLAAVEDEFPGLL